LRKASIVNLAQIRTIDKKRLASPRIALLPDETMGAVDRALKNSLGLV